MAPKLSKKPISRTPKRTSKQTSKLPKTKKDVSGLVMTGVLTTALVGGAVGAKVYENYSHNKTLADTHLTIGIYKLKPKHNISINEPVPKDLVFDWNYMRKRHLGIYRKAPLESQIHDVHLFVNDLASRFGFKSSSILKLIKMESNYNHIKKSGNRHGLMQVPEAALGELKKHVDFKKILGFEPSPKDLYNPYLNIIVGTYYLKHLVNTYKSVDIAITVYGIGPENYMKMLKGNQTQKSDATRYLDRYYKAQP